MYNDTHKIIEFIGNLITSDNITLLDTFLNGTQKLGVFFFLKCDPFLLCLVLHNKKVSQN